MLGTQLLVTPGQQGRTTIEIWPSQRSLFGWAVNRHNVTQKASAEPASVAQADRFCREPCMALEHITPLSSRARLSGGPPMRETKHSRTCGVDEEYTRPGGEERATLTRFCPVEAPWSQVLQASLVGGPNLG